MQNNRIILLNGPPRSGKDTSAEMIDRLTMEGWLAGHLWDCELERFSMSLKFAVLALVGVNSLDDPLAIMFEENKEAPQPLFSGRSYRQMQIALSEQLIKPYLAKNQFGLWMVHRLEKYAKEFTMPTLIVIPDSGFDHEAIPLINHFGASSICLIRVHRDGTDYSNDSRGYIHLEQYSVDTFDVYNNSTKEELKARLKEVIEKWLTQPAP